MVLLRVLLDDQGWPFVHRGIKPIRIKRECKRTMKYKTSPLNPNMQNLGSMLLCCIFWCNFFSNPYFCTKICHRGWPHPVQQLGIWSFFCDSLFRRIELWTSFVALPSMLCGLRRSCLRRGISFWGWCHISWPPALSDHIIALSNKFGYFLGGKRGSQGGLRSLRFPWNPQHRLDPEVDRAVDAEKRAQQRPRCVLNLRALQGRTSDGSADGSVVAENYADLVRRMRVEVGGRLGWQLGGLGVVEGWMILDGLSFFSKGNCQLLSSLQVLLTPKLKKVGEWQDLNIVMRIP